MALDGQQGSPTMIKTMAINLTEIRDCWKTDEKIRHRKPSIQAAQDI
jgi:hypothetical protein